MCSWARVQVAVAVYCTETRKKKRTVRKLMPDDNVYIDDFFSTILQSLPFRGETECMFKLTNICKLQTATCHLCPLNNNFYLCLAYLFCMLLVHLLFSKTSYH